MPAPLGYAAELYLNNELVEKKEIAEALNTPEVQKCVAELYSEDGTLIETKQRDNTVLFQMLKEV